MKLDVDYELTGCVNNAPLEVRGRGVADFEAGRYQMDLRCRRVPMHWDPALVILICCDRMYGVCAKEGAGAKNIHSLSGGDHVLPWRRAGIYDEQGREVGYACASSHGHRKDDILISRSQLLTGHIHLDLLEEVTEIVTPYDGTMMAFGPDMLLLTSAYSFGTDHGNSYKGFTVYPYKMCPPATIEAPQLVTVESVSMERGRYENGDTRFEFVMKSKIEVLTASQS